MKKIITLFILLISANISAQKVQGIILDSETEKPIKSVKIQVDKKVFTTNKKGEFSFRVPKDWNSTFFISHISYKNQKILYQKIVCNCYCKKW